MAIRITQIHPAEAPDALNTEWFLLANDGERPFNTRNCVLAVGRKGSRKRKELGTIDPGFVLAPGDTMRVITGNPGRKSHGKPPEDEVRNYHLFLGEEVLRGAGTVLTLTLRSLPVTSVTFDPEVEGCVAPKPSK
jgi:hypothetical protein